MWRRFIWDLSDLWEDDVTDNWNPSQPRDAKGQWGSGSGGAGASTAGVSVFGGSMLDKLAVNVVSEYFPATQSPEFYGVKLRSNDEPGRQFEAGGQSFEEAGIYNHQDRRVECKPEPGILSHELGHDEFHEALDQAQFQMNGAAQWMDARNEDVFENYMGADGMIKHPTSPRERLYNNLKEFNYVMSDDKAHPSDYSRAWSKESVVDIPRPDAKLFPKFDSEGNRSGEFSMGVQAYRSTNEAYAEFSRGYVLDQLAKKGLITDWEGRPSFKSMGTAKSRKAYLNLRKSIHETHAENVK